MELIRLGTKANAAKLSAALTRQRPPTKVSVVKRSVALIKGQWKGSVAATKRRRKRHAVLRNKHYFLSVNGSLRGNHSING